MNEQKKPPARTYILSVYSVRLNPKTQRLEQFLVSQTGHGEYPHAEIARLDPLHKWGSPQALRVGQCALSLSFKGQQRFLSRHDRRKAVAIVRDGAA